MASPAPNSAVRRAAVVVPIVAGTEPSILFVQRAAHLRRNAGEVGFPGGLVEADDAGDLRRTALRELHEEIGVPDERIAIVRRLPDALVINRTVLVAPFVGVIAPPLALRVDANEVAGVFDVPLARLFEPGALHEGIERYGPLRIPTWQFDFGEHHIWGATARMLRSLLETLEGDEQLRAALTERGVPATAFAPLALAHIRAEAGPLRP
jgi:8-oxo-dGTP pyrophosphatase MutT (NUDIX family)